MPTARSASAMPIPRREWLALFGITLLAAGLRFFMIDQPAIWGDEAATWSRVCGTWDELLEQLGEDGFVPIHYEIYWLLHQWLGELTPFTMRLVPAIAGTLTVPAIWWVGRQLLGPRTGLLAALLLACSAYMLVYSRDAKMYALLWFFVTVHVGCLLAWVRTRDRLWWWAWVLAGCAMLGTHAPSMFILPVDAVIIAASSWRRGDRWPNLALFAGGVVIGALIMSLGPIKHYGIGDENDWYEVEGFSKFFAQREATENLIGIFWVREYNRFRTGEDMVLLSASAYMTGWEWPAPEPTDEELASFRRQNWDQGQLAIQSHRRLAEWPNDALRFATTALLVGAVLGALPWPRRWTGLRKHHRGDFGRGRVVFWLGTWIGVPIFAAYCLSFARREPGGTARLDHMIEVARDNLGSTPGLIALVALALCIVGWVWHSGSRPATRGLRAVGWVAGALALCGMLILTNYIIAEPEEHSVWMARYFGVVAPGFLLLLAWLWLRLPSKPLRVGVLVLFIATNLGQFTGRLLTSEPPTDRLATDVIKSKADPRTHVFHDHDGRIGNGGPAGGWEGSWWTTFPVSYYLLTFDPDPPEHGPPDIRGGRSGNLIAREYREAYTRRNAARELTQRADELDRVIFWTSRLKLVDELPDAGTDVRRILARRGFMRVESETFDIMDHWRWSYWAIAEREVWERPDTTSGE
ncbi:MAG: glycosyltransferase family 39 protein [Planctomycetota bacterium]